MGLLNQGSIFYWLSCIVAYFKLCDKVCQWYAAYRWFSPGTPVYSTNKTDRHDITEALLKVELNIKTLTPFWNNNLQHMLFIAIIIYLAAKTHLQFIFLSTGICQSSAHDEFLEQPSSSRPIIKRLEKKNVKVIGSK